MTGYIHTHVSKYIHTTYIIFYDIFTCLILTDSKLIYVIVTYDNNIDKAIDCFNTNSCGNQIFILILFLFNCR